MSAILFLSDVVADPIIKEAKALAAGSFEFTAAYEEDLVSRLLSISDDELKPYCLLLIHSDQLFHQKDQSWQKMYAQAVLNLSSRFTGTVLLSNAFSHSFKAAPLKTSFGNAAETLDAYNNELAELLKQPNVYVFDFLAICQSLGTQNIYNYNLGHLYQMPYNKPAIKQFAASLVAQLHFLTTEEKKVIVLDCDNTLWKGIVGEDGVDGIACDKNTDGIFYYNLQAFLKAKKEEGFLLCICSKNNEADVKEVFEKKNLPLKWSDFIVRKINWDDKFSNLTAIAKELNVGVDSFVFLDDNLFELNSIKELLKGVACVHITGVYADLAGIFDSFLFRRRQILQSDVEKTQQYELEQQRKDSEQAFASLDDFIKSLDIQMDIRVNDVADYPRMAQMTGKTNQFNMNKRVYNEAELAAFAEHGRIYSLKVSDKYGDYGTVGLILVDITGSDAIMENYLMSCRALGKRIEYDFFDHVIVGITTQGLQLKDIRFVTTEKNLPAQTFLKTIKEHGSKIS